MLAVAPRQAVYRFYNQRSGVHFYTPDANERDTVIAGSYAAGVNYSTLTANPSAIDPISGGMGYRFEGTAYQALATQGTPLYRFFNASKGYHFLTTNLDEANAVVRNSLGGGNSIDTALNKDPVINGWGYKIGRAHV